MMAVLFSGTLLLSSCASEEAGSAESAGETEQADEQPVPDGPVLEQVQFLVDNNRFDQALEKLKAEDTSEAEIRTALRDTHFLYGEWLMYHADSVAMNERMPKALRHFRRVVEMEPQNEAAQANIQQIESVYRSMDRPIPEGVAD
ncbi:MAG: hypothetical protein ACOC2C_05875 [Cyclonatronaceae bacterium]